MPARIRKRLSDKTRYHRPNNIQISGHARVLLDNFTGQDRQGLSLLIELG
jgi:hypothetical protein